MLIILTICHVLNGTCKEEQLPVPEAPRSQMMCLMQAQPIVAEYMQLSPNYRAERVRCVSEEDYSRREKRA